MYEVPFGEDGGSGDIDKMRLALSKQNKPAPTPPSLSSQIPGYGKPVPPAQTPPDPLGAAAGNFTELATKFNPLMMMKSMQESVRTLNPAIPVAGAWADVAQNIQTAGAEAMYDILGNPQGIAKMQQNYVPVTTGRFYQAPTTPVGKEFETDVIKAMDASKMPAMWPVALNQPIRPPITPNDVRVMGAEATRIGRQVKDIPTDFYNAQSGMQRLDPITGQPTYGARLGQAERGVTQAGMRVEKALDPIVQDIMAKGGTSADILAAMAGQPTYAMRPTGSRLQSAVMPETAKEGSARFAPAQDIISGVIDSSTITPVQALDEIQNKILNRGPETALVRKSFENFLKQKANEMFPDAPTPEAALQAYKARFGDREASAPHTLEMYDEFLQTPSGMEHKAGLNLPTAEELPARHEAASNWLNSQFTNYINEKIGTPDEPAAVLARQGLTYNPADAVYGYADLSGRGISKRRTAAGMPAKTPTDEALAAADQKLSELQQQAASAATRMREQQAIAIQQGYGAIDPNTGVVVEGMNLGRYEPFAQASREADKATAIRNKQQQAVDDLRLGVAYENASDLAVNATTADKFREDLGYDERQFYPSAMRTPDAERIYTGSPSQMRILGFEDIAKDFYNDVMSGKIPLNKVKSTTVEKYIRSTAEGRIAAEKLAQVKEKQYKADVDKQFSDSATAHIPNDKVFGNVGALEITNRFTPEEVAKLLSEDVLALDVCIAEGGSVSGKPNLWHPNTGSREYIPIYDVVTGRKNPDATSPRMSYINAVANGSQMVSFRDMTTDGQPVAVFDFNPSSTGKYDINFASGRKNGKVKPEYVEGIKSYLNSREDSIRGVSDKMTENLGIYDSKRMTNRGLAAVVNTPVSQFEKYDLSGMPRFVTHNDMHNYIDAIKATEPQVPVPAVLSQRPSESLDAYLTGAVSSAVDNVLDSQRRAFDEAGESNNFIRAESFFAGIRNSFSEALTTGRNPVAALDGVRQQLYELESRYANSNHVVDNTIAEGIQDLISDLNGHAEYARTRQAAEAGQQPRAAVAQRRELDAEQRPDYLRMTHNAALGLDLQIGVDAGDEMRGALRAITEGSGVDPVRNTDAFITSLRGAAEVAARGSVETALNELADRMESVYIRDWEPEVAPAQQAAQPFDWVGALDSLVNEVSQNTNPGIGNRVDTIAYRIAERTNPRLDPAGYAAALRAVDNEHVAVGHALRQLALAVEAAIVEQPPALRAADLDNQRNDRIFQLENAVNDPELNPDDLRFLANELSNPLNQAANNHWISLAENERRDYAQALRKRANYIEFSPADFAIRLSNEAGANIPDLRDAVQALNDGTFDHEILRGLPAVERDRASQRTAIYLNHILQGMQDGVPPAAGSNLTQVPMNDLLSQITQMDNDTGGVWRRVNENTEFALRIARRQGADPATVGQAISQGAFVDPDTTSIEREYIARVIAQNLRDDAEYAARNQQPEVTPAERNDAYEIATGLDDAYYQGADSPQQALAMVNQHLSMLRDRPLAGYNAIVGLARDDYVYSPALIQALITELELIRDVLFNRRNVGGNAEGGPVRGYQAGGSVKKPDVPTPYLFSVPTYSETVAYEMYPGQKGQDDQRDAARHMLAAGTLSRKYGPGVAEFLGKAHEFTTSPLQAVKSMFGGQMPADYGMDTHNNRFGAELGQRAKSQAELEDLVQAEAERASRTQTQGQAFIKKANGGIVQQNPTTDQMRYALTMRRK